MQNQYDTISQEYEQVTLEDPIKHFTQYPSVLKVLGNIKGKTLLDIGCGAGYFTSLMARQETTKIIGYDPSSGLIEKAKEAAKSHSELNILYFHADKPPDISYKFDIVTAILVLNHAENQQQLKQIFQYAHDSLPKYGKFVCLLLNPDFQSFNKKILNRRFLRPEGTETFEVDFLNNTGQVLTRISATYFSQEALLNAASQAGFTSCHWEKVTVSEEARKQYGPMFLQELETNCPYIILVANKT